MSDTAPEAAAAGDEDIPSDFFDDFNKDDFMEGLSVIDSWDDEDGRKRRIEKELDRVEDLRELIGVKEDQKSGDAAHNKYKSTRDSQRECKSQDSSSRLDDYIKPGSRRDLKKTNEAIKKDKQDKVMEHIAKHLESGDSLRPPGTELDDFFDETKSKEKLAATLNVKQPIKVKEGSTQHERDRMYSPKLRRYSPRHSPHRSSHVVQRSQRRSPRMSPRRYINDRRRYSPDRRTRRNFSPPQYRRRSPNLRHSPNRRSPMFRRASPRHSRRSRSRSPYRKSRRSISLSPKRDSFLYPQDAHHSPYSSATPHLLPQSYIPHPSFPETAGVYSYSGPPIPGPAYAGGFQPPYEYAASTIPPVTPIPQPVPAPVIMNSTPTPAPSMVPPPLQIISPTPQPLMAKQKAPYDALAQLVAEGKISREDYLKLAPNKNAITPMDTKTRVMVVNRCQIALSKLGQYQLPNRLVLNGNMLGEDSKKSLAPKFCSPLKRQVTIEFEFTKETSGINNNVNKQIINTIINTIGLEKVIARPKTKTPRNMRDAATQTTKPSCDVCAIRESTKYYDATTSINPEQFSSSIHTQVIEEDLYSSRSVFNPTGSVSDGSAMSIAHMTPAQLVSQLAARAKTLKQTEPPPQSQPPPNQYNRRPNYNYDGRGGFDQQYQNNYGNYRH